MVSHLISELIYSATASLEELELIPSIDMSDFIAVGSK